MFALAICRVPETSLGGAKALVEHSVYAQPAGVVPGTLFSVKTKWCVPGLFASTGARENSGLQGSQGTWI